MSSRAIPWTFNVLMNGRDIMPWCSRVEVRQPEAIHREFTLTLKAYHHIEPGATWDIYGTYQTGNTGRGSHGLIRNGYVPADAPLSMEVPLNGVPTLQVTGYDYVWVAQRRRPRRTLVLVPSPSVRGIHSDVRLAFEQSGGQPPGRYQIVSNIRTFHDAVTRLCQGAGFDVDVNLQNYPWAPWVMASGLSYWDAIRELVDPFAPHVAYSRWQNRLIISDSAPYVMGSGTRVHIPDGAVDKITAQPRFRGRGRPARIIVRFPPWR